MLFLPRAVQLRRQGPSPVAWSFDRGGALASMPTPNLSPLLVAYFRKRGLAKTLKAFVAETSLKDAGEPVVEDLEAIYGSYLLTKGGCKKRKTDSGPAKTNWKKSKLAEPKVKTALSFSEDSDSSSEEEAEPVTTVAKSLYKAGASGALRKVAGKPTPAPIDKSSFDYSESDSVESEDEVVDKAFQKQVPATAPAEESKEFSSHESEDEAVVDSAQKQVPTPKVQSSVTGTSPPISTLKLDKLAGKPATAPSNKSSSDKSDFESKVDAVAAPVKKEVPGVILAKIVSSGMTQAFMESSSDESEDEGEAAAKKVASQPSNVKPMGMTQVMVESSSDDRSEDQELIAKEVVPPSSKLKPCRMTKVVMEFSSSSEDQPVDKILVHFKVKPVLPSSSEDLDVNSKEEQKPVKVAGKVSGKAGFKELKPSNQGVVKSTTALPSPYASDVSGSGEEAPSKKTQVAVASKEDSSSSEEIDDEGVVAGEPVKVAKVLVKTGPKKFSQMVAKAIPASSSSSSSDYSDYEVSNKKTQEIILSEDDSSSFEQTEAGGVEADKKAIAINRTVKSESLYFEESDSEEETTPVTDSQKVPENVGLKPHKSNAAESSSSHYSDSSSNEEAKPAVGQVSRNTLSNCSKFVSENVCSSSSDKSSSDESGAEEVSVKETTVLLSSRVEFSSSSDESEDEVIAVPAVKLPTAKSLAKLALLSCSEDSDSSSEERTKVSLKTGEERSTQASEKPTLKPISAFSEDSSSDDSDFEEVVIKAAPLSTSLSTSVKEPSSAEESKAEPVKASVQKQMTTLSSTENPNQTTHLKRKRDTDKLSDPGGKNTKIGFINVRNGMSKNENEHGGAKKQKLSYTPGKEGTPKFFQKIDVNEVKYADPRLQDNSYWAKNGADEGWGAKAQEILGQVKGKGFRHAKTKKKRGSYKGGAIDFSSHSIKFEDSEEE